MNKELAKNLNIKYDKLSDSKFISFSALKSAISDDDFDKKNELVHLLLDVDLNVAGSIDNRKSALLENAFKLESDDKAFLKFWEELEKNFDLYGFVENLASAVYFGISLQDVVYKSINGYILPVSSKSIPFNLIKKDSSEKLLYIDNLENEKLYLNNLEDIKVAKFYYNFNKESFKNNSLSSKLLYYSVLKHSVITLNLEYLDKNAIPPVIIKSDSVDDEKLAKDLLTQLQLLKSNSLAIFDDKVEITTLKQDRESKFLELIQYCDKKQNELILGGNLTGSSESVGSQALGTVHQNRLKEIVKADAKKISAFIVEFIKEVCKLNFAQVPSFHFYIDVVDDEDVAALKIKAETKNIKANTLASLTSLGYEIPLEYVEEEFGIKGIKWSKVEKNSEANKIEFNHIENNTQQDESTKAIEQQILDFIEDIAKDVQSYEELEDKIAQEFNFLDLEEFEELLLKSNIEEQIAGAIKAGNDDEE